MKTTYYIILSLLLFSFMNAQPVPPEAEYIKYKYDDNLQTDIITYQYANLWDFNNDNIRDSVAFIGNGGAHTYFHFELKLSTDKQWRSFPTFLIDRPYLNRNDTIRETTQFSVADFDNDGILEIYLNIDNPFGSIPIEMKNNSLTSKRILLDFKDDMLNVENYKPL